MVTNGFSEIEKVYELEMNRIVDKINHNKIKKVLLQFPEGIKPYAQVIADEIEGRCKCDCFIWLGTCFGACDLPLEVEKLGIEMIVQFGHSNWSYESINIIK